MLITVHEIKTINKGDDRPPAPLPPDGSVVQRLKGPHQQIARLFARGEKNVTIAAMTGYSQSYVCTLQRDPAFQALIELYKDKVDAAFDMTLGSMASLSTSVLGELTERLQQAPEAFNTKDLIALGKAMLDRTGHGPSQSVTSTSVHISGQDLLDMKKSMTTTMRGQVIDAQCIE